MSKNIEINMEGHVAAVVCNQQLPYLALDFTAIEQTTYLQDVIMYQLQTTHMMVKCYLRL